MKTIFLFWMTAAASIVSGCAQHPRLTASTTPPDQGEKHEASEPRPEDLYEWNGNGRTLSRIEIDVDEQKAVFFDGNDPIGWTMVASGVRFFATPRGRFTISEKVELKRSNLYGTIYDSQGKLKIVNAKRGIHRIPPGGRFEGAKMPYFMRLTEGGVGMHGGPIPNPGDPASHGCIRLPHPLAAILYEHVRIGTPVRIVGSGPA